MNEPGDATRRRFERLSALLDETLALPPEQRADFVSHCEPAELRDELAALLALDDRTGPLDHPPHSIAGEAVTQRNLGRYRLLDPLGEGGMATVWRAEHKEEGFSRQVAVKCLKTGLATPELRARFLREQQILAGLEHPNIARLYDAGISDEGVPFIVMELIDGVPITEYCDRHKLSIRARLKLFRQVLDAVACAHQNLIVHRDLKPANILVCSPDEAKRNPGTRRTHAPDSGAARLHPGYDSGVKLLDFGIAKTLDEADEATRTQMRALTPGYAAPEQFRGDAVTTATDVYALGVILHELLTGSRPDRDTDTDPATAPDPPLASQAVTGEPDDTAECRGMSDSRRLSQALHGDLDTLVAAALRPLPAKRYRDAAALDAEIERYLLNLPLNVRRSSRAYRTAKFLRRNWLAAGAVAGIAAALVIGTAVALWQAGQARFEAERATAALEETEQALSRAEALQTFLLDLFRSAQPDRPRDQLPTTEEILALGAERAMDEDSAGPAERIGMLLTIGEVYLQHDRHEQVEPLFDKAVSLARAYAEQRPDDLALSLERQAALLHDQTSLLRKPELVDAATALLLEAESLIDVSGPHRGLHIKLRAARGRGAFLKGDHEQAIALTEPLVAKMNEHGVIDEPTYHGLLSNLAIAYTELGNLSEAASVNSALIDFTVNARSMGPESSEHAHALHSSVLLEYYLGRFDVAITRAREAVALYDRIHEPGQPSTRRAGARNRLAHALLYAGHFEEALAESEAANVERALSQDVPPSDSEVRFLFRGYFLNRLHRWREGESALRRARELLLESDDQLLLAIVEAMLATAICEQDEADAGEALIGMLDSRLPEGGLTAPLHQALIHEARATCHYHAGRLHDALTEVDTALALETGYPGRVMHQADRRILRARTLEGLERNDEAASELDLAEQAFLDIDLGDHPHFANIQAARRELFSD